MDQVPAWAAAYRDRDELLRTIGQQPDEAEAATIVSKLLELG